MTAASIAGDGDGPPLVWAPEALSRQQRSGQACVYCSKIWPRPRIRAGVLGEAAEPEARLFGAEVLGVQELGTAGSPLYACDDCAPMARTSP